MGKAILATDQDLLFGKIAVSLKYCTAGEVEKGFGLQAQSPDRLALGQILVGEGFITPEQHSEILTIQRRKSGEIEPVQEASKESVFLGKLAVRERLLTEENVNSCLRIQALEPERRSLGTIMVEQGFLAPKQLKALLALQQKKIMSCPKCRLSFTVLTISGGKNVPCPRCRGALEDGKPTASLRTDAQLKTGVVRMIRQAAPQPPPESPRRTASSIRMVKMVCPICSRPFEEPVDTKGQVDCPNCNSSFSA